MIEDVFHITGETIEISDHLYNTDCMVESAIIEETVIVDTPPSKKSK
jgi:hypothetical protein